MRKLYQKYMGNVQDRTMTTNAGSFSINALTGTGQLALGIFLRSPWYIVNGIYYLLLCAARGQALRRYRKTKTIEDEKERYDASFAIHKRGGIFICLMGISYLGICLWMYFTGESRVQNEMYLVLGVATIAFTKIGFAIHGMIINRHMHDPIISLFKKISFLDAMVSIVVTQCTLLTMMEAAEAVSSSALFGMGISLLFLLIGILMLTKKKKYPVPREPKKEKVKVKEKSIRKIKMTVSDFSNRSGRKN